MNDLFEDTTDLKRGAVMSLLISGDLRLSKSQIIPAVLGEAWGGGYFAGYISHTADGNATHALIVAPRATGATGTGYTLTTNRQWKTTNTITAGTGSAFDGVANTAAMVTAGIADHPAANFCVNLSIGGFTDWYLPARLEMDIAYFNLKPSTTSNVVFYGQNIYSVPRRNSLWTAGYPSQTFVTAFNTSAEAFVDNSHWSSTYSANAVFVNFANGTNSDTSAPQLFSVRAFRRIAL